MMICEDCKESTSGRCNKHLNTHMKNKSVTTKTEDWKEVFDDTFEYWFTDADFLNNPVMRKKFANNVKEYVSYILQTQKQKYIEIGEELKKNLRWIDNENVHKRVIQDFINKMKEEE